MLTWRELDLLWGMQRERDVAETITDAHVLANEKGMTLAQAYPTIRDGYCLSS